MKKNEKMKEKKMKKKRERERKGCSAITVNRYTDVTMVTCSDVNLYRYINIMMVKYSDITVHSNTKSWWKDVVMYTCTAILVTVGRCDLHVYSHNEVTM